MIIFKRLRYKNFLSTGDQFSEVILDKSPTTLILGENGSGKSTMLDALTFVLFSKPFRKINKPQLINSINNSNLLVEVEFIIGSKKYLIRRGIKPAIFEIYIDDKLLNQDAKAKDYQDKLEKQILKLNYKSFTQIIILGSSSFQPFMQLPLAARRDVIEDLLDIQIFSIMNQLLKEKIAISKSNRIDVSTKIEMTEEKVRLVESYKKEAEEINNDRIQKTADRIVETEEIIRNQTEKASLLQTKIDGITDRFDEYSGIENRYDTLDGYFKQISRNIKNSENEISLIDSYTECPTCEQQVGEEHKHSIITKRKKKVSEYQTALKDLKEKINVVEQKLEEYNNLKDFKDGYTSALWKLEYEIKNSKNEIKILSNDVVYLEKVRDKSAGDDDRISSLQEQLGKMESGLEQLVKEDQYQQIASSLLKDTGVKTLIIKQYLPVMNQLINKYLQAMDSYFNFELDENFNETIKSRYRDVFSYDSFSEGEKMRIDLALLFTWRSIAKLKNSANTNLLILD